MVAEAEITTLTLDHELGIRIKSTDPITVNWQTFRQNIYGLQLLAGTVREHEIEMRAIWGTHLQFQAIENPFIPAQFNWFSLTFNNHMRQIALVDLMQRKGWTTAELIANNVETSRYCTAYAISVDDDLYRWRNKVAAHSAATDPRWQKDPSKSDTEKLLQQSVWINVTFRGSYFEVGNIRPVGMSELEALPIWALTEKFDKHRSRFWPEFEIKSFPPSHDYPAVAAYTRHLHRFGKS